MLAHSRPVAVATLLSFALSLALVGPVYAQTATDAESRAGAGNAYDQGTAAYAAQDFARAAHWFETADRLAPSEIALSSAIRSHRRIGDATHAARAASLAVGLIARYPNSPRATALGNQTIAEVGPQLERVTVRCDGCQIELDQVILLSSDFFVVPGTHHIVAHWSADRTVPRSIEATAGRTESIALTAPPMPAAPPPSRTASETGARSHDRVESPPPVRTRIVGGTGLTPWVGIISGTLAAGAILFSVWSVWDTYNGADTYNSFPTLAGYQDGQTREVRSDIAVPVAGALLLWTVIDFAFLTRWSGPHVEVIPTTQGSAAMLVGRF